MGLLRDLKISLAPKHKKLSFNAEQTIQRHPDPYLREELERTERWKPDKRRREKKETVCPRKPHPKHLFTRAPPWIDDGVKFTNPLGAFRFFRQEENTTSLEPEIPGTPGKYRTSPVKGPSGHRWRMC